MKVGAIMTDAVNTFFNQFHIGTYYLQKNARSEGHIRDMQACGIDLVFGMDNDKNTLDLFQEYGIAAVVTGVVPGWFGGRGENAGTLRTSNPREAYDKGVDGFVDHPAIVGVDVGDEPSSLDFPYYGEIVHRLQKRLPDKFPYLNVYPSYGMLADSSKEQIKKELGQSCYKDYLKAYCECVDLPYLSFDHYVYSSDVERFIGDLSDAATFCKMYGKKLYVMLQVNSREEEVFISEDQLCFQAFSALAFGVSAVSWACYSAGWWHNQVLDDAGNKTPQYKKLKNVNRRLWGMAAEYTSYQWQSAERLGSGCASSFGALKEITSQQAVLLGRFVREDGAKAIFISPLEVTSTSVYMVSFRLDGGKRAHLCDGDGKKILLPDADGVYRVHLKGCEAGLITVE